MTPTVSEGRFLSFTTGGRLLTLNNISIANLVLGLDVSCGVVCHTVVEGVVGMILWRGRKSEGWLLDSGSL